MPHPLDRPVWNALATGWSRLSVGGALARRIDPAHGPFGAASDGGPAAQAAIAALVPADGELWLVERDPIPPPPGVAVLRQAVLAQMIAPALPPSGPSPLAVTVLTEADAAEMRALALMTRPGPFHPLTHRLGRFIGIREGGQLVAMAGERMRLPGFAEVSGVCTHPGHRGHGHARMLMHMVAQAMLARGETPFLHAYADHDATIALYERLGFTVRATLALMVVGPGECGSGPAESRQAE